MTEHTIAAEHRAVEHIAEDKLAVAEAAAAVAAEVAIVVELEPVAEVAVASHPSGSLPALLAAPAMYPSASACLEGCA